MCPQLTRHLMKNQLSHPRRAALVAAALSVLLALNLGTSPSAVAATVTNAPTAGATNTVASPVVSAAPKTTDSDDDDDDSSGGKHSFKFSMNTDHDPAASSAMSQVIDDLIPLVAIIATFATPILIVFFICYFKYRRRQENLALAREFLSKGLPIPPELLDPSQQGVNVSISRGAADGPNCDLRKGFRLTFIGLALAVAFYVTSPHSTMWGWGLIPMIMGLGFLVSGWVGTRRNSTLDSTSPTPPPDSRKLF